MCNPRNPDEAIAVCLSECDGSERTSCMCFSRVFCLFVALLILVMGVIGGVIFGQVISSFLPAILSFAAVMLALIIALWLYRRCNCRHSRRS